jgi:hypothetical protein
MTKAEQDEERALNWQLIKRLTMAIFSMDVTRFSFPVGYSEPRSFIERSADLFSFLVSEFLERASGCRSPEDRLATVAAGIAASFHLYLQSKKPWNPTIGETYIGYWENGCALFGEQISHHPPISAVQVCSPTNAWRISATFCFGIDQGLLKIDVLQRGTTRLEFRDGTIIEWEFPTIRAIGLLKGDRIVRIHGPFQMRDLTHQLSLRLKVSPKASKHKGIASPRATTIWGGVQAAGAQKYEFCRTISGDYAKEIFIDGRSVWRLDRCFSRRPIGDIPPADLLPSDSRYRIDRAMLLQGDLDAAEHAKVLLETLQRKDVKLRGSAA